MTDYFKPLLKWYDAHQRDLPWRQRRDAYGIWLSEIMLQQTMVAAVIPYYQKFLRLWPRVEDLAGAEQAEVLKEWAGLGYYSRARNLHKAAISVVTDHSGLFPDHYAGLLKLPGIGRYTAGAIAAIAFGEKVAAVDGNVIRVLSRLFGIATPIPRLLREIELRAHGMMQIVPDKKSGDAVQALMELGATICIPKNPKCLLCPWQTVCTAYAEGRQNDYPVKAPKKTKPLRTINVYIVQNGIGEILLAQRPQNWMLGGMMGLPSTALTARETDHAVAQVETRWRVLPEKAAHSFTHFDAELVVHTGTIENYKLQDGEQWLARNKLALAGLPTFFAKVIKIIS